VVCKDAGYQSHVFTLPRKIHVVQRLDVELHHTNISCTCKKGAVLVPMAGQVKSCPLRPLTLRALETVLAFYSRHSGEIAMSGSLKALVLVIADRRRPAEKAGPNGET